MDYAKMVEADPWADPFASASGWDDSVSWQEPSDWSGGFADGIGHVWDSVINGATQLADSYFYAESVGEQVRARQAQEEANKIASAAQVGAAKPPEQSSWSDRDLMFAGGAAVGLVVLMLAVSR